MALKLDDIDFNVRLPELPREVPLYRTTAPSLGERSRALDLFGRTLRLEALQPVELPDSVVYAGKRGELEYFPASGGLWARNACHDERFDSASRDWPGPVETVDRDRAVFELEAGGARRLLEQARRLFAEADLVSEPMSGGSIVLDQVTELDENGNELRRGAGTATARFDYALDGIPVVGAGAKSRAYFEPERGRPTITGMFHAWRPIAGDVVLPLAPLEEALGVGLLQDAELALYRERGYRIEISHLIFAYMALPATVRQTYLFPAFQIEGRVCDPAEGTDEFVFARFHHAASPERYQEAGVLADCPVRMN